MKKKEHAQGVKGVHSIHVSLNSPRRLRKEILSLGIETIQLLKHYERVKALRVEKEELLQRFRKEVDLVKKLVHEINSLDLPMSLEEVRNHPRFKVHEKKEKPVKHEEEELPPVHKAEKKHEVVKEKDKLEDDLDELQRKLASL